MPLPSVLANVDECKWCQGSGRRSPSRGLVRCQGYPVCAEVAGMVRIFGSSLSVGEALIVIALLSVVLWRVTWFVAVWLASAF
jgi:hypothetical protein